MSGDQRSPSRDREAQSTIAVLQFLLAGGVVLAAGAAGIVTYALVLEPLLAHADQADIQPGTAYIPDDPIPYSMPQGYANVVREGGMPSSTLAYRVTLECNDLETYNLIHKHRARFLDMLNKLHDARTRSELDNTLLIKESIQRQALQKTNDLLQQLQDEPADNIVVTSVFHDQFYVQDPL